MAIAAATGEDAGPNHPHAVRMGWIAGIAHNMVIGCLMGSFSVMLSSVETRMGVTREMSSIVGALVIFGSALISAVVGPLIGRYSLRLLMLLGAAMSVTGYLLLAFTNSYAVYVGCYLALFGPSMSLAGAIGPATLVTRWFSRGRGLALGLVHLSLVVTIMPLLCNWILDNYGAQAVYLMMALLIGLTLLPAALMIQDYPPGSRPAAASLVGTTADGSLPVGEILRRPAFWMVALPACIVIAGIMMLTFNMIPLAQSLGYSREEGAVLQTVMSFCGMAGSIMFGWVADRIGGARGLALLAFNMAVLLGLTMVGLPFWALAVVFGLFGMHGAGMVPNFGRALAHSLGQASFSRAFGLKSALGVPITGAAIWAMGATFTRTGSYALALSVVAVLMLAAVPLAWSAWKLRADSVA